MPAQNPILLETTAVASGTAIITGRLQPVTVRWRGADAGDTIVITDGADNVIYTGIAPATPATNYTEESDLTRKTGPITDLKVSTLGGGSADIYYHR